MATLHLHSVLPNPTSFKSTKATTSTRRRLLPNSVRCAEATQVTGETQRVTVRNGNDSLDICRVLNGMWQTSGGWGRIDRDDAVEAMLRYADAGLSTFDMADHCKSYNVNQAPNLSTFLRPGLMCIRGCF